MFLKILTCLFLVLGLSAAQVEFTMGSVFYTSTYTAGVSTMKLTWDLNSGSVTLKLMGGPATNLTVVETIASGLTGNSYSFTPRSSLLSGEYAFEIDDSQSKLINYSKQFTLIAGSGGSTSISASSSSSPSASTSTSQLSHRLSTGAKAAIGVGAALGALLFIALIFFASWYGRRSANKNKKSTPEEGGTHKAELETVEARQKTELEPTANIAEMGGELDEEEKKELQRRRRAAELEGSSPVIPGVVSEKAELEARRKQVFEMS